MSEEQVIVTLEDDFGRVQTSIATSLSAPQLMDKIIEIDEQQSIIERLEQRDYYNQSERYKILGRAIELASDYIHTNDLEYYDFCGLVTEFEEELLEGNEE